MKSSELLKAVSIRLSVDVKYHHLIHAQRIGLVRNVKSVGGWSRFEDKHVDQLVKYMLEYSRGPKSKKVKA